MPLLVWLTDHLGASITQGIPASIGILIRLENHVAHAEAFVNKVVEFYIAVLLGTLKTDATFIA